MGFNLTKFKVQLKLAVNRSKLLQSKKNAINQQQRREISTLLESGKVEHVIREDYNMEAMEVLEMLCDLLLARSGLLEMKYIHCSVLGRPVMTMADRQCDPAIQEAVHTIIYAASRSEIKELVQVRDQLASKFGREFAEAAMSNRLGLVNPRVVQRLQVSTPDPALVTSYLREIAKTFGVPFDDDTSQEKRPGAVDLVGAPGQFMTTTMAQSVMGQPPMPMTMPTPMPTPFVPPASTPASVIPTGVQIPPLPFTGGHPSIAPTASSMPSLPSAIAPSAPPASTSAGEPASAASLSAQEKEAFSGGAPTAPNELSPPAYKSNDPLPDFDDLAKRFEQLKKK